MTISLRNLPPALEKAIVEKSERDGLSLNKTVTQLLEKALQPPAKNLDFEEFAGLWTAEAGAEFDKALAEIRQVDPEERTA